VRISDFGKTFMSNALKDKFKKGPNSKRL